MTIDYGGGLIFPDSWAYGPPDPPEGPDGPECECGEQGIPCEACWPVAA